MLRQTLYNERYMMFAIGKKFAMMPLMKPRPFSAIHKIASGRFFGLIEQQVYLTYARLFGKIGGLFLLLITLILSLGLHHLITDYGASPAVLLMMMLLNIPGVLFVVIPFSGIFASTTLFHRLEQQNELIIMRSVGFNAWRIVRPIALIGSFLTLLGWINGLWILPLSSQNFNTINRSYRNQEVNITIKAEKFNHLGSGMMLYAKAITPEELYLDVLISIEKPNGSEQTLIARTGQLNGDFNSPGFILRDGTSQEFNPETHEIHSTDFSSYQLKMDEEEVRKRSYWAKSNERFLPDLLFPDLSNSTDKARYNELVAKGHDRLVTPIFFLLLPMLASLLMLHAPFDRRAYMGKVLSTILLCFGLYLLERISLNMAASNIHFLSLTYSILFGTALMIILLLRRTQPLHIDPFSRLRTLVFRKS